jgi:Lon protease-like protein
VSGSRLPLFPLSSVVLFPGCVAPLHVFEPRYRQMTADALAGERTIGMIAVRPEGSHDLAGDPPLYEIGCAGFVADHRKLADGRYHIVLRGTHRFRIVRELPRDEGRLYRVAETETLRDPPGPESDRSPALRAAILDRLRAIARRTASASAADLSLERLAELDDGPFANSICQALGLPAAEKQGLLEAPDLARRLERLEGLLAFHVAVLGRPDGAGTRTVH